MLSLTRKVEYALIGLTHMAAQSPGAIVTVRGVADRYGIPGKLLAKVFHELKGAHILNSHQGKNGGYTLAQDPRAVSLAQLIDALEGPSGLVICCDGSGYQCPQFNDCIIQSPVSQLNLRLRHFLDSVNVTDFISNKVAPTASEN